MRVIYWLLVVDDQSASSLCDTVVQKCIEDNGLKLAKLRGQGYDGAASMSGIYSGVQAQIVAKQPKAVYVHCAAHNLNLVLNDAVSDVVDVRNFLALLNRFTFSLGTVYTGGIFCQHSANLGLAQTLH